MDFAKTANVNKKQIGGCSANFIGFADSLKNLGKFLVPVLNPLTKN